MGADTFSVRRQGRVEPRFTEDYTFYVKADDGVRLWVNGELLVDVWRSNTSTWAGKQLSLTAGEKHDVHMDDYEGSGGGAMAQLMWWSPSMSSQPTPRVIHAAQLYSYASDPALKTAPAGDVGTHLSSINPRGQSISGANAGDAARTGERSDTSSKEDRRLVDDMVA